jgi:hypothetical protein
MDMHRGVGQAPAGLPRRRTDKPWPEQLPDQRALEVTTEVPGELLQWLRTAGGEWLGPVTYQLPFADERHKRIYLERQLLPAGLVRATRRDRRVNLRGLPTDSCRVPELGPWHVTSGFRPRIRTRW